MFTKKIYLKFLLGLLLMAFAAPPAQAETMTVADGTATSYYVPLSGYNMSSTSYSQIIYPASLFESSDLPGCNITGLRFYYNTATYYSAPEFNGTIEIYVGETENTGYSSATDRITDLTRVYSGIMNVSGREAYVTFDDPYTYDGTKNLVVEVRGLTQTSTGSWTTAYGQNITGGGSVYSYGTTSSYNTFVPKTTFTFEQGQLEDYAAKVSPTSLAFGKKATGSTTSMNVTLKNTGANPFTPSVTVSGTGFSTTYTASELASKESATIPVAFAPTTPGDFSGTLTVDCGNGIEVFNIPLTGNAANELPVSDGTATSSYLPVYGNWYDAADGQINQMIYPASMLAALDGKKITSMTFYSQSTTFFSGGSVTFSLGNLPVETATFSSAERITTDDLTQVYSDVPTVAQEWTITFPSDVDFIYNGGNLLLDVVTTKGTYKDVQFYGTDGHTNASWNSYNNGNANLRDFLPKVTFAYEDVAVDPVYSLEVTDPTTGSIDFGTVNVGQSGTATVTIKNTGNTAVTPNLTTNNECFTVTSSETGELAKKATRTCTITFTPTEETNYNATLTVADADGLVTVTPTVTLTGAGHALAAFDVTASEESGVHNFGDVFKDGTATWNVTITNNGKNAVTPTITGLAAPFSTTYTSAALASGESVIIAFTFAPTAIQAYGPTSVTITFPETEDFQFDYTLRGTGIENTGTLPPSFYDGITYNWTDSEGVEHTSKLSDIATDPDQMIALMREVYTNKSLPGPWYRGYDADGNVETAYPVAYPAIGEISRFGEAGVDDNYTYEDRGWNIPHNQAEYPFDVFYTGSDRIYKALNANEYKPNEDGLTLLLVEMKDLVTSETVSNTSSLRNIFDKMFKSVRVVTHSKKVDKTKTEGETTTTVPGTLFKIDCDKMNRFFFLGKGRLRLYNDVYDDHKIGRSNFFIDRIKNTTSGTRITNVTGDAGPFYEMFEQFSPVSLISDKVSLDVYQDLVNMEQYGVEHDCQYIPWATSPNGTVGHEFNMYGKASLSEDCQDVRDLMFFVPDQRMKYWDSRDKGGNDKFVNYYEEMAPTMGLYVIRQNPITGEQKTYEGNENNYELTLTWDSNLTDFVPADKGVYYIYQVNEDGSYTLVGTTDSQTKTLVVNVAMQEHGQQVTYVIQGQDNTQFLSLQMSNEESFIIPGTDPYEKFQLNPNADYYSRFDPAQETNFYANGMQIKTYPDATNDMFAGKTINYYRQPEGETEWTLVATANVNSGATAATAATVAATQRLQNEYVYGYKTNSGSLNITTDANGYKVFDNLYDNFKADVSTNEHPDYYKYKIVVDGTPADANKYHSNEITIRVFKTQMSTIDGTFTQAQVNNDTEHTLGLKSTAFNIEVEHSSKTEILRYDAYRWTEGTDYYIIDQSSDPDDEQDIAPNGIAGNQGTSYTTAMNNDYTGSVNVAQGQTAQAPFEDSYPEEHIGAYTYAPVVEVFAPTGWGRDDYNTYGAPLQTTATGKTELTVGEKKASNYTFQINNVDYVYYQIPLTATVTIPQDKGYEIYKIRAWRVIDETKVGKNFLGEIDPDFAERADYDYLFEEIDDASAGQQGIPIGTTAVTTDDPNQVNVTTGTFGAKKLADGQSFTVQFIVRTYFTKPTRDNEGGDYFISQTIVDVPIDSDITTGIVNVKGEKQVAGVKYYNLAGMESDSPFNGVNIVVTRYTDGSTSTSKVLK